MVRISNCCIFVKDIACVFVVCSQQAALFGLTQATHFDKMAALCHQAFHLVISGVTVSMPGRKVMAGLVMKTGPEDDGKVICLGSGEYYYVVYMCLVIALCRTNFLRTCITTAISHNLRNI